MQLIFDRVVTKKTPGEFRTRVIQDGVHPSLHIDYKNFDLKQYFKEGRGCRTERNVPQPVPSGGGLYPLELYLLVQRVEGLASGVYHYFPLCHTLEVLASVEVPHSVLTQLFLNQPYLADAAVVLVISANLSRTMHKYEDRGYRYVLFEAGHAMQNMNLVAAALGVGAFNVGGFFDSYLANLMGINLEEEVPLYCAGLGVPTTADRVHARDPNALFSDT